ncbi:GyrI-like domain-containing protein [Ornithinibacillus bavariensis]|uniref:AraC effector-binding domain-containing protein n=1 Tax=Ornithinibacillus bavariensis TaxID=545502 RepID=A0A919X9C3_9BACI|nr:GyrI-like domain-containing protein [Ornithinibacillus bavariensis]GIO27976.1 hypothetical protein J43TS3_25870 [Ornithinibacillus bavariensis]HAM81075.1 AraC family transcriptional regulator [Ornithinibacillus sp.]
MSKNSIDEKAIKELGEIRLVGFRVVCEGNKYQEEISKAAALLKERTTEIKNVLHSGRQVGAFVVDASTDDQDGYWVCVQVSEYSDIPNDMVTLTVPPQRYATTMHNGPIYSIMNSYEKLHQWIADKGLQRARENWSLEFYHRLENAPEDVQVELCDSIY